MANQTSKAKKAAIKDTQRKPTDLEALRIEAKRPVNCDGTYCQKGYHSKALLGKLPA